jgi:hypothetical protein
MYGQKKNSMSKDMLFFIENRCRDSVSYLLPQ